MAAGSSGGVGASSSSSGHAGGSSSSGAPSVGDPNGLLPADSVWQTTNEWYRDVSAAPVAEHSDAMLAELPKWGRTGNFQIDFSFVVLDGANAPTVTFPPGDENDDVPVPLPVGGLVEGGSDYASCPDDQDCHVLVVDRGAQKLYEIYQVHQNGSTWQGQPSLWQLDKTYPRGNRGQGCTSADAAGLAITPGLIGFAETKAGHIGHALRLVLRNEYIRGDGGHDTPNVAYPASHGTTAATAPGGVPYGGRLRLKTSVADTDPRFTSPGARVVLKALHTYGMIVADGGDIPLMAEVDTLHAPDTWDGVLGSHDLVGLLPTDFEVVGIPLDHPGGAPGYHSTRAEYEADLKPPLGCTGIVQP